MRKEAALLLSLISLALIPGITMVSAVLSYNQNLFNDSLTDYTFTIDNVTRQSMISLNTFAVDNMSHANFMAEFSNYYSFTDISYLGINFTETATENTTNWGIASDPTHNVTAAWDNSYASGSYTYMLCQPSAPCYANFTLNYTVSNLTNIVQIFFRSGGGANLANRTYNISNTNYFKQISNGKNLSIRFYGYRYSNSSGNALDRLYMYYYNYITKTYDLIDTFSGSDSHQFFDIHREEWNGNATATMTVDILKDKQNDATIPNMNATNNLVTYNITAFNNYLKSNCTLHQPCIYQINFSVVPSLTMNQNMTMRIYSMNMSGNITYNYTIMVYDETTLGRVVSNYSFSNGTNTYSVSDQNNISADMSLIPYGYNTLTISASGYAGRTFYFTNNLSSEVNMTAYLIQTATGIYENVYVSDAMGSPVSGAIVTVQYPFSGGIYSTVEQKTTDSVGAVVLFLNPSKQYHFLISAGGYVSLVFDAVPNPVNPTLYVRILTTGTGGATISNFTTMFSGISYRITPDNPYHNATFNIIFELSDSGSSLEYMGLNLSWYNGTSICTQYTNSEPSGTTLTCVVPNTTGTYIASAYFKKAGYEEFEIYSSGSHRFFVTILTQIFSRVGEIVHSSISDMAFWIVVVVIMIVVGAFVSRFTGGIAVAWLEIGIVGMAIAMNPAASIAGVSGWYVLATMIILTLALMTLRSYL